MDCAGAIGSESQDGDDEFGPPTDRGLKMNKKGGRLIHGIQKGTSSFAKNITLRR